MFRRCKTTAIRFLLCIVSLAITERSFVRGDEGAQEVVFASTLGSQYALLGEFTGRFPDRSINFEIRHGLRLVSSGRLNVGDYNNVCATLSEGMRRIVLCDVYQGFAIYDWDGVLLSKFNGDQLLTRRERNSRPGGSGCHPEGFWCHEINPVVASGRRLYVTLHSGRKVEIDLPSGLLSRADEEVVMADKSWFWIEIVIVAAAGVFLLRRIVKRRFVLRCTDKTQ